MSMHNQSNQNRGRNNKHLPQVRRGEMPRWSNGVLLNGISGARDNRTERNHRDNRAPRQATISQPAIGKVVQQEFSHGRKSRVLVLTKREASRGFHAPFNAQFERTRNSGSGKGSDFIARAKVHGRPVFLDSRSPKPTDLSKSYGFELVGENGACTVYFARIIPTEGIIKPSSISIDVRTGKMVANNCKLPRLSGWKSKKPYSSLPAAVSGFTGHDDAEDDFDDIRWGLDFDFGPSDYGSFSGSSFVCTGDCEEDECTCEHEDDSVAAFVAEEVAAMTDARPVNLPWCHNCGCRICECDGTPQVDGQPYLRPFHLTEVRMPTKVRAPRVTSRRRNYW